MYNDNCDNMACPVRGPLPCLSRFAKPVPTTPSCYSGPGEYDALDFIVQEYLQQQVQASNNNRTMPQTARRSSATDSASGVAAGQYIVPTAPQFQVVTTGGYIQTIQTSPTQTCVNLPSTFYCQTGVTAVVDNRTIGFCGRLAPVMPPIGPGMILM